MKGRILSRTPVVDVRLPVDGLILERLPADEEVEGRFAFEDCDQALLQFQRRRQAILCTALVALDAILLTADPVPR